MPREMRVTTLTYVLALLFLALSGLAGFFIASELVARQHEEQISDLKSKLGDQSHAPPDTAASMSLFSVFGIISRIDGDTITLDPVEYGHDLIDIFGNMPLSREVIITSETEFSAIVPQDECTLTEVPITFSDLKPGHRVGAEGDSDIAYKERFTAILVMHVGVFTPDISCQGRR